MATPSPRHSAKSASTSGLPEAAKAISPPPEGVALGITPSRFHKLCIRPGAAGIMAKVGEDSTARRPRMDV
jgi:hypothetical protein